MTKPLRDSRGRFVKVTSEWEAALRSRLLPCQLADLEKTGSFCVRGGVGERADYYRKNYSDSPYTDVWRIYVHPPQGVYSKTQRVIDPAGRLRNAWFFYKARGRFDDHDYLDGWEAALAFKVVIEADSSTVYDGSCSDRKPFTMEDPVDYDGQI